MRDARRHERASRRIAVLGDMAELGSLAELAHFRIGEQVARAGIDVLVTVGALARRIAEGARAEGMDADAVADACDRGRCGVASRARGRCGRATSCS